jgi:UPF0176 protein
MESGLKVLAFYKFAHIDKPRVFARELQNWCRHLGIKGRILVGEEGINGGVSGTEEQTETFKQHVRSDLRFSNIVFKEDPCITHPFARMNVKVKDEIVRLGTKVDLKNTGNYLSPAEFLELSKREDIVLLDTRNDYEWRVGKFKNAVTLPMKTFREFPDFVEKFKDKKDKKIVMYCTGGIRCEKASAYMKEQGFNDVSQLEGGILTFCKELPDTAWEGTCFVFDKRLVSHVNTDTRAITNCESCHVPCDLYKNCRAVECDRYVVLCQACDNKLAGCCSETCLKNWMTARVAA